MSKPPVFGDPAVALKKDLQAALDRANAAAPAGSGVAHPPGTVLVGQQMSLTPAQRAAQVPIQNSNIQRLEAEWDSATPSRKRDIVVGIKSLLQGFPGTTSAKLADFERQLGGRRRRKHTKRHRRRSTRKSVR